MSAHYRYLPPEFDLVEFDDSALHVSGYRWLPSWNGKIGDPAEEVTLAWDGDDGTQAAVSTRMLSQEHHWRRWQAMFVLLGGNLLTTSERPEGSRAQLDMAEEYARDDTKWRLRGLLIDGRSLEAEATRIGEVRIGWCVTNERLVSVVTVGIGFPRIRLRTLTPERAIAYRADPTGSIGRDDLYAQQRPR